MAEFDLRQALDCSSESDETEIKSLCFEMTDGEDKTFSLDEGLNLVVSHNPKTMQCVATLVLAVNRMKKSLSRCCELSDKQLCSEIMASLVEETIVKMEGNFTTEVKKRKYKRLYSEKQLTLCDSSQKDLCQVDGQLKLQAITLKGGHHDHKVNFKLAQYIKPSPESDIGQTVVLSIMKEKDPLHISSSLKDGKAVLNLERCSESNMQEIGEDSDMDRFLFYKRTTGINSTTFESVKCRGWYISTSYEDEYQPVEMCRGTTRRNTCFTIK
ncbi:interleukin-1 beta [Thunnus maccoyii]|uniref:interleukin-1 beta n=1 Tax=Thunnus maccoyii TaxID=8240 RepID=UPI001C4CB3CC|nr:interleukin-1 beta [Thunnus maccoyii]XP_042250744.1 interleukin-1 beta [Thunnus maccoyii]XP_042250745.1 interleukin-1 beta [Thunnus maccoyii]